MLLSVSISYGSAFPYDFVTSKLDKNAHIVRLCKTLQAQICSQPEAAGGVISAIAGQDVQIYLIANGETLGLESCAIDRPSNNFIIPFNTK